MAWLLIGAMKQLDGYDFGEITGGLRGDIDTLRSVAKEMASVVQDAEPDAPELSVAITFWRTLLEADRQIVPVSVLDALGRWAFVTGVDEGIWVDLTYRTLELTEGVIDYSIEVADRCKTAKPSGRSLATLRLLLGNGEPWERDYVAGAALEALRLAASRPVDQEFEYLRARLIELGRHEAVDITPSSEPQQD